MAEPIRILLVDDHAVVREGLRAFLELHDAVSQKLFSLVLSAEAAATLLDRDPAAARGQVARVGALTREALDELRALIFELRPPDLAGDGIAGALRKHVELLRRGGRVRWTDLRMALDGHPEPRAAEGAVLSNWEI